MENSKITTSPSIMYLERITRQQTPYLDPLELTQVKTTINK
jgi:hypothetical protein